MREQLTMQIFDNSVLGSNDVSGIYFERTNRITHAVGLARRILQTLGTVVGA